MTETLTEPAPATPPPPVRRLARDPDERVVAGVCAGLGRYTDTDPVLWRVTVAVLTVFGGAGLALYALGWLLMPRIGEPSSIAERSLRSPGRSLGVAGVVVLALLVIVVLGVADVLDGGAGVLLVLAGIGYLVVRERRELSGVGPVHGPPPPPMTYGPATWSDGGVLPQVPAPAPRPRSRLGTVTVSLAALTTGVLLALRLSGVGGLTAPRIVAAALLVVGAGLVVGTWFGRARWLIAVGLVLALALGATSAASHAGLEDGIGERRWLVTGSDSYALGGGEGVLDLRGLRPGARAAVDARVGVGQLTVLVPDDLVVDVVADVDLGEINVIGLVGEGAPSSIDGEDLHEEFTVGGPAGGQVDLDLEVRAGEVVMRRVER